MEISDILQGIVYFLVVTIFAFVCWLIYVLASKKKGTDETNQYLSAGDEMRELNKQTELTNRPFMDAVDENNNNSPPTATPQRRYHRDGQTNISKDESVPVAHDYTQSHAEHSHNGENDTIDYDDLHRPNDFYKPRNKPSRKELNVLKKELKQQARYLRNNNKDNDDSYQDDGPPGHDSTDYNHNDSNPDDSNPDDYNRQDSNQQDSNQIDSNQQDYNQQDSNLDDYNRQDNRPNKRKPYRPDGRNHHPRTPTGMRCLNCYNDHVKGGTTKNRCSCNGEKRCNTCAMTDGSCKWCISGGNGKCIPSNVRCRNKPAPNVEPVQSNKNYKKCIQCAELQKCGTYSADSGGFVCGGYKRDYKTREKIETNGCNGRFNRKNAVAKCRDEFKH